MAQDTAGASRYTPVLILLGLLALLLWKECGSHATIPDYEVRGVQADSLAAPTAQVPARLYFTVSLHSSEYYSFRLQSLEGTLYFRNASWAGNYSEPQNERLLVPAYTDLRIPMVVTLPDSLGRDPAALSQLRQALHGGTAHDSTLLLNLAVNVYTDDDSYYAYGGGHFPLQAMPAARPGKIPQP